MTQVSQAIGWRETLALLIRNCSKAAANALVEICRVRGLPESSQVSGLKHAIAYLEMITAMYSFGHPSICITTHMDSEDLEDSVLRRICRLLKLSCRIRDFWAQPAHITHELRHWDYDSKFMDLKHELDESLIRQPDDLRFSSSTLLDKLDQEQGVGEYLIWPLAWHFAVILLNRVFLPITNSDNRQYEENINYPGAPDMFIQERLSALESSATAISIICSDVVACGRLFMVWESISAETEKF